MCGIFPQIFLQPLICVNVLLLCLQEESSYINGKAIHKITVIPKVNLTVSCSVTNRLGEDVMTINISSSKLILGSNLVGLFYFLNCWKWERCSNTSIKLRTKVIQLWTVVETGSLYQHKLIWYNDMRDFMNILIWNVEIGLKNLKNIYMAAVRKHDI